MRNRGTTRLNLLKSFPLFSPYSGGSYQMRAPLAQQAINDLVPALHALQDEVGTTAVEVLSDVQYAELYGAGEAEKLALLMNQNGSDKATTHGYYKVYASILARVTQKPDTVRLFEIGLGTNNLDVTSNMGLGGRPGASLRAFRDFLSNGQIYGADIDRRVLFSEDRITTHFIDQTDRASFTALGAELPGDFDLMIDDGLHLPTANLNSLSFFLGRIRVGGFAVVEDIPRRAEDFWQVVAALLPSDCFEATIVTSGPSLMFVVERKA
ncbi:MAG: hypothetical protein AAGA15_00170 [Pseudomonadota bacterium]